MAQRRGQDDDTKKGSWRSRDKKAMKFASSYVEELIAEEQHNKEKEELSASLAATSSADQAELIEAGILTGEAEEVIIAPSDISSMKDSAQTELGLYGANYREDMSSTGLLLHNPCLELNYDCNSEDDSSDGRSTEVPPSIYLPLLCIGFYLKNKLSKVALADHLKIVRLNDNSHIRRLSSVHNLLSKYESLETEVTKDYICAKKSCGSILILDEMKKNPLPNQPCGHKRKPTFSSGQECFVLRLPIEKQLVHFIRHGGLAKPQNEDPNYRGDVTSGGLYRKLKEGGIIDEHTITLQLNTDGAEIFETSEFSFWPLMGIINELSYKLRRSYVILLGIYYGNKKPPMKQFLEEPFNELNRLKTEGFFVNNQKFKAEVVIVTVDSVARAPLYGMTLFNGAFGCGFCLAEGKRISKGRGSVRVYPEPFDINSEPPSLRTLEQHRRDLDQVLKTKKPVHGILGPTTLSKLIGFDYIKASVPDYLHSTCEGAFKLLINLWTLPKFRKCDWFIGDKVAVINKRLSEIQPPYEVTRTHSLSAGFSKLSVWKASMFRSFFLYYFPLLEDLLPKIYFQHCCQLSYGINLLLRERVSVDDVRKVDLLFRNFVREFELIYREDEVRVNIHFMTHLAQAVLDWGGLWSTSTFIPEWFNGELVKLCHGSQCVADQMARNYLLRLEVRREVEELMNENSIPSHVLSHLKELFNIPRDENDDESGGLSICDGTVKLLGNGNNQKLSQSQESAIRTLLSSEKFGSHVDPLPSVSFEKCSCYPRFKIMLSKSIFTTTSYTLSPKRLNYCALMIDGTFLFIDHILYFNDPPLSSSPSQAFVLGRKLGTDHEHPYTPELIDGPAFSYFTGQTKKLTGIGGNLIAYEMSDVSAKCVVAMKSDLVEQYIVTALVNNFESD